VDWPEDKQAEFVIKDNVSGGEWDWDMLANQWDAEKLEAWGLDVPVFTNGEVNGKTWNLHTDEVEGDGDGIDELLGYDASSIWYNMPRVVQGLTELMIPLPELEDGTRKSNLTATGVKYSRTIPEEIRRVVVTYMTPGDFFLENTCGWSTFGGIAKLHGYSGIGVDIWDTALEYSRKQIQVIPSAGNDVEIMEADGMNLPFEDAKFDYVYCNPPFMDVELYSGKENEIASGDVSTFRRNLERLCAENYRVLKPGKLCTMTISDTRRNGVLLSMATELILSGQKAGFALHDFVIAHNRGMAHLLRKREVSKKRCAKNHEYVITFVKPLPKGKKQPKNSHEREPNTE
jgi:SAM-dependent methyltransferase